MDVKQSINNLEVQALDAADPEATFLALCKTAEARLKEKYGAENLKDVLPTWSVYKAAARRRLAAQAKR